MISFNITFNAPGAPERTRVVQSETLRPLPLMVEYAFKYKVLIQDVSYTVRLTS